MRKPYSGILLVSILLAVLYIMYEQAPSYLEPKDELYDKVLFGIELAVVLFCVFSAIYLASRKRR